MLKQRTLRVLVDCNTLDVSDAKPGWCPCQHQGAVFLTKLRIYNHCAFSFPSE